MSAPVYRKYDAEALEREYDNRAKVGPDALGAYRAVWADGSQRARRDLAAALDVSYGPSALEALDIYAPTGGRTGRPVAVYVHGGYWHMGDKADCAYVALGLCSLGMVTISLNYGLAPDVAVGQQVEQCAAAVDWIRQNVHLYGGDRADLHLIGHSAGAHLVMMLVAEASGRPARLPPGTARSICALSGIYDLEPVRLTSLQEPLRLDHRDVASLSPARAVCSGDLRALVAVGSLEGDEYLRQTDALVAAWSPRAPGVRGKIFAGDDHFSIRTGLDDPESEVCRDIADLVRRGVTGDREVPRTR